MSGSLGDGEARPSRCEDTSSLAGTPRSLRIIAYRPGEYNASAGRRLLIGLTSVRRMDDRRANPSGPIRCRSSDRRAAHRPGIAVADKLAFDEAQHVGRQRVVETTGTRVRVGSRARCARSGAAAATRQACLTRGPVLTSWRRSALLKGPTGFLEGSVAGTRGGVSLAPGRVVRMEVERAGRAARGAHADGQVWFVSWR